MVEAKEGILGWFNFNKKGVGFFSYAMHRISAVVIVFYLYLHYTVLSNILRGQVTYDSIIKSATYGPHDAFIVMDVLLSIVIFYHGANGVRLMLNEMGIGLKHHKLFFYAFEIVSVILLLIFLYYAWLFVGVGF